MQLLPRVAAAAIFLLVLGARAARAQDHAPEAGYLDDRSTPEAVVNSLYDAINRQEYARAYSYWEPGTDPSQLPPFEEFVQGYATTQLVQVTLGEVGSGVGAGQLYFTVPVTLVATMTDGSVATYVGCYQLHLARPQLQAVPPFRPMGIQRANVEQVDNAADTGDLMSRACPAD
jgi:hypothetical protein